MAARGTSIGEAMEALLGDRFSQLRTIDIGRVTFFSKNTQTATVQPVIFGADGEARVAIERCAVVFPGAYWDVQIGETGLLLVCDADYRQWWRDGQDTLPATSSSHRVGNSVFLPGIRSNPGSKDLPNNATVLEKPSAGGEVRLGVVGATEWAVHDALLSPLNGLMTTLSAWVTAVDGALPAPLVPATANLLTDIATIIAGIAANSYRSSSVKVEL